MPVLESLSYNRSLSVRGSDSSFPEVIDKWKMILTGSSLQETSAMDRETTMFT